MPGALDGVKVIDFTVFQQGPQATLVMADMGADVIKVEPPMFGDLGRVLAMYGPNRLSAYHLAHSRGKRSITTSRTREEGRGSPASSSLGRRDGPPAQRHGEVGSATTRARAQRAHHLRHASDGAEGGQANHPAFDIAAQAAPA
jgi:hypothetical protein